VSDERGILVSLLTKARVSSAPFPRTTMGPCASMQAYCGVLWGGGFVLSEVTLYRGTSGYVAHKKTHPPGTLPQAYS
jgi:hypothetical protein